MTRAALLASLINSSNTLTAVDFTDTGNTVFGDASVDTLTINGTNVSIPNNLNIGANTFFINSSNNRVGINTALPLYDLDVTGNVNVSKTLWTPSGIIGQSTDQGTGVLQVTGQSTFNGAVTDKSLNLQGGNNLLTYSQDFTNAAWTKSNGATVTANTAVAPDGTTTANTISFTADELSRVQQGKTSSTLNFTYSIWLKVNSGTVDIRFGDASSLNVITITSTWQRFTTTINILNPNFTLRNAVAGTAITFFAWGAQLEQGSVASNYTPTTTAAVTTTNNISVPSGNVTVSNGQLFGTPSYTVPSFANTSGSGFGYFGTTSIIFAGNATPIAFGSNAVNMTSGAYLGWTSNTSPATTAPDLTFYRDAANTLAQRNSTNAQTFRLYGTYTDASNYQRLSFLANSPTSSYSTITTEGAGTGSATNLVINAGGGTGYLQASGSSILLWRSTYLIPATDNAIDLGIASTNRFKNAYFSGVVTTNSDASINTVTVGLGGGDVSTNTAVGNGAMATTATGGFNSAFGQLSLTSLSSGIYNSAYGWHSLFSLNTGVGNNAFGMYALNSATSANSNNAFGYQAGYSITNAQYNNIFGYNACNFTTTGSGISAFGHYALQNNTTASNLTAIGTSALQNNTTNVATLGSITGGSGYTNGTYTGVVMTLSSGSTAITYPTATIVVSGGVITTVTLTSNGVGFKDTTTVLTAPAASIGGTGSGFSVPVATLASGTGNVAVGYQAGYSNSVGTNNTFNGYQAGYSGTTANQNSFYGYQSGYATTTGLGCSALGLGSLQNNTSGQYNTAIGFKAGNTISTANNLTAIGQQTLLNATGAGNSAFGAAAGLSVSSGTNNVLIGLSAANTGTNLTTGSNNTVIGASSAVSTSSDSNSIVIGANAVGLGSNTTVIGNTSTTLTQTYGVTKSTNYTVATLPSASTSGVGARAFVTDALTPVFGATVVTGGAVPTPVYSDGTNWKVG